ncbi:MAG: AAA family ATPase, partial [Candidatus Deferrimicrobiaceae bacterium]
LFRELDDLQSSLGIMVIATTNRIDLMEPALLRAGRFDFIIDFPLPSKEERIEILQTYMRTLPLNSQIDMDVLADMSEGWTGADIESLCKKAVMLAVEEYLKREEEPDFSRCKITSRHFEQAALQGSSSTIQSRRAMRH